MALTTDQREIHETTRNSAICGAAQTIHTGKPTQELLGQLLDSSIVLTEDWENLPAPTRAAGLECADIPTMLSWLQEHALLTEYQAGRIAAGTTHGLVLGNYRGLNRLGAGAMGVVFKTEHTRMRRQVAIKVLPLFTGQDQKHLLRFLTEMRAIAQLQHPNIVAAMDAGGSVEVMRCDQAFLDVGAGAHFLGAADQHAHRTLP